MNGGGRPDGFVTYVNSTLRSLRVESCDYFLAVNFDDIYNVYLPTDYHYDTSQHLFTHAFEKLCRRISSIIPSNSACLIVGNFNYNLTFSPDAEISDNSFYIVVKDQNFTYIHHSSSTSKINHVVISLSLEVSQPKILCDYLISDHLSV